MAKPGRVRVYDEPLSKQVNFLLTETQYELVRQRAWEAKMTLADYVRRKLGFFVEQEEKV